MTFEPVPHTVHIAHQQMRNPHSWWAIFIAWAKGARR